MKKMVMRKVLSISIFRRFSLFLQVAHFNLLPFLLQLSISIFRRFSLFRRKRGTGKGWKTHLSISIFRRFSLFPTPRREDGADMKIWAAFNLHFQEIFFVSHRNREGFPSYSRSFQSPFSGDFLCFEARWDFGEG